MKVPSESFVNETFCHYPIFMLFKMFVVFQFVMVNLRGSSKKYMTQLKLVKWKDSIVLLIVLVNGILNWIRKDCKFMKKLVRNVSNSIIQAGKGIALEDFHLSLWIGGIWTETVHAFTITIPRSYKDASPCQQFCPLFCGIFCLPNVFPLLMIKTASSLELEVILYLWILLNYLSYTILLVTLSIIMVKQPLMERIQSKTIRFHETVIMIAQFYEKTGFSA